MPHEPSSFGDDPQVFGDSLRRFCALRGIDRSTLAKRLGAPYQTVVPWLRSFQQSRGNKEMGMPGPKWRLQIQRVFPDFKISAKLGGDVPDLKSTIRVRRRELPRPVKKSIRQETLRAVASLQTLVAVLPAELTCNFYQAPPKRFHAYDDAVRIRRVLSMGALPIPRAADVLERLGVSVISVGAAGESGVSLASGMRYPAIAIVGSNPDQIKLRHELLAEMGHWLVGGSQRAAGKSYAARDFADELLVPTAGLSKILLPRRPIISAPEVAAIARIFMVKGDVVERQCRRLKVKVLIDKGGDSDALLPKPSLGYRNLLEVQARALGGA